MTRQDFLSAVGISATALTIMTCEACKKDSSTTSGTGVTGPINVSFTLDLSASANAALLTNGGFLLSNGVIIARTTAGAYVAVQQSCTHESYNLVYQGTNGRFFCANHGSEFSNAGAVLSGPASKNLTVYNTMLTGTSLKIYS